MMDHDLIDLLAAFRGGDAAPERLDALVERLNRDEAFQRGFVDEIRMLGMLKAVQSPEPRWLGLYEELGWDEPADSLEFEREERIMQRVGRGVPSRRALRSPWRMGVAAALALLLVGTFLVWSRFRPIGDTVPRSGEDLGRTPGLASIVKLDAARWASSRTSPILEGTFVPASRLRLESGRAVLQFHSGVLLTIEGPSDVALVSMTKIFCRQGRLRAMVPSGAEGFVVETEGAAVIDLGTAFGMNVKADGRTQVRVFEGAVEAAILDASGFPRQIQRLVPSGQYELNPAAGRITEVAMKTDDFIKAPDLAPPMLPLDPAYSGAVLRPRPASYWRFEARQGDAIANEIPGGPTLRIRGPVRLSGEVKGNGYAIFPPRSPGQHIAADGLWDFLSGAGYAVELWFLSDGSNRGSLVGLYPPASVVPEGQGARTVHSVLVETTPFFPRPLTKPDAVRFLRRWPLSPELGTNLYSGSHYLPRRWYHVVAQEDGNVMQLYVNGEKENACVLEPGRSDVPCQLVIGRRRDDMPGVPPNRDEEASNPKSGEPFVGQLDELAIYDHALSAEEIREHFRLGNVAGVARPPLASP